MFQSSYSWDSVLSIWEVERVTEALPESKAYSKDPSNNRESQTQMDHPDKFQLCKQ